jgi:MAF protein
VELVIFGLLLGVTTLAVLARVVGVPYPITLVLGGSVIGFIPGVPSVELVPDLVLLIFQPHLLYGAAFFTSLRDLRRNARPIALLAIPLVGVTMVAVAVVAHEVIGLGWGEAFVLGADTIVVLDNRILGKPEDAAEARSTLSALRGRSHQVITAIALLDPTGEWLDHTQTDVHMRDYTDAEIEAYIKSAEPFDKAGSYAIQDPIFQPVERCRGCYCNVVGLPVLAVRSLLAKADFSLPEFSRQALPYECHQCPLLNQIHD